MMKVMIKLNLLFALLFALNSSVDSTPFCNAFQKNNFRFSYVLRTKVESNNYYYKSRYNFIVNGKNFLFTLMEDKEKNTKPFLLPHSEQSTPFFSSSYRHVVWLYINGKWGLTLFSINDWKNLTFGYTADPNDTFKLDYYSDDRSEKYRLKVNAVSPNFVTEDINNGTLVFIYQTTVGTKLDVKLIQFEVNQNELNAREIQGEPQHLNGLKELIPKFELTAVVPQFYDNYTRYGVVYIFKDQKTIKYCFSDGQTLDKDSCQTNLRELVDCSYEDDLPTAQGSTPTTITATPVPENDDNYLLIASIVIIVVIIVILIAVIGYLCGYFTKKASDLSEKSSQKEGSNMTSKTKMTSGASGVRTKRTP